MGERQLMTDRDEFDEAFMRQNQKEMQKINHMFLAAFILSFAPVALDFAICIPVLWAGVITLGHALFLSFIPKAIIDAVFMVVFILAELKNKKCTICSIPAVIAFFVANGMDGGSFLMLAVQIVLYVMCLFQYKNIERLKSCPGYPQFNTIFFNDRRNTRIISDEQVKIKLEENKAGVDMDFIELDDPQALEIKKPRTMEDLFGDDIDDLHEE